MTAAPLFLACGRGAFFYVNDGTVPVLSKSVGGSTGGTNLLWIGDVTDGDQIGGTTEWEYVRWTDKGQFEPGFGSDR